LQNVIFGPKNQQTGACIPPRNRAVA